MALESRLLSETSELTQREEEYAEQKNALPYSGEEQIQAQKERSTELDALPAYIESDEYIEKVAREKFGLIYPDETVIKPEG